jgi:alpha,alpha-trehalase
MQTGSEAHGGAGGMTVPRVLREYALLADGERGAVIGPDGSVVWLCVPRWDSPAAFSGLLGGPGGYTITPADPWHVWGGYYENGSLIWRSRWVGDTKIECREALAMPADPHRAVLLRRVEALDGPAKVTVALDIRARYGRGRTTDLKRQGETWTGRSGGTWFRWSGAAGAKRSDGMLGMEIELAAGTKGDLVLEISDREFSDDPPDAGQAWAATEEAWSGVAPACDDLIAGSDARHAYAVLHGLTSATGALVAAATTSLPERLEGGRNYDYRYAWIRDQCYAGLAVAAHGPHPLLAGSVRFVTERLLDDGPKLMPAYTVAGEPIEDEGPLRLRGFPGGSARAGNGVRGQFQLDAVGETLSLLAAAARHDMLTTEDWRAAAVAADVIGQRWQEPDAGIWELDDRRWTHSRLACVSGLRAIAAAAAAGPPGGHGRCTRPRAHSCSAGSGWPRPSMPAGTRSRRRTGSSGAAAPAARPRCTPRSMTSTSGNSGATCRRRSCTPACLNAPLRCPATSSSGAPEPLVLEAARLPPTLSRRLRTPRRENRVYEVFSTGCENSSR